MNGEIRWLTVDDAADRARCGVKTIYRAVRSGQLRAVRIGGRRELKFLEGWIDAWLLSNVREAIHTGMSSRDTVRSGEIL
jgi:excisionase family DNA binding protein